MLSLHAPPSLKLGFLLFDYFPFGGLQRDCVTIAQRCAARGHDVTIFTRTWQGERPAQLRIELFGRRGSTNPTRNRHWLQQLETTLPVRQLDGLIGFNKLPGLDVYYGADPCYVAKARNLKSWWYRLLPRYRHFAALERAVFARGQRTELLVLTERDVPQYREIYGTEQERFHVLPPNATRRSFTEAQRIETRSRLRVEHGWPENMEVILFVGSDFRRKGLERALRAFAALPPAGAVPRQLVVIGACSPGRFGVQARTLGVADRVHFLGGRHDVPDWMLAADAMIHPAHVETAGIVLLEALTFGLPLMATAVCGYAPYVAAAGGVVLPEPFDQDNCTAMLATMLRPEYNLFVREQALKFAATEDLYSCHDRVVALIEQTVTGKRRA